MKTSKKAERFLRAPEVYDRTGLKKTAIRNLEVAGDFPRRIKLGERASGWLESEIQAWIDKRVANRAKQVSTQPCA